MATHVSVILPTYNREKYLKKTIESVLKQKTDFKFEIIVVDDASTDGTEELISEINSPLIKYLKLKENSGGAKARNHGISTSKGKYIAFIDSDTTWLPNKLQKQVDFLESNENYIGVYSKFLKIKGTKSRLMPKQIPSPDELGKKILLDNCIDTPTSIVRKEAINSVNGFDESLPRFQDWELFIRLSRVGLFYGFNEPLIDSLDLQNSISRNDQARLTALKIIRDKHFRNTTSTTKQKRRIILKIINASLKINDKDYAKQQLKENPELLNILDKILLKSLIKVPHKIFTSVSLVLS